MQVKVELENVAYGGISLNLDGQGSNPHDIASACVFNEDSDYMRNYVRDDGGRISRLNFMAGGFAEI